MVGNMAEEGWAGDASSQPWWTFFVLLGACVAVAAIFAGVFEFVSASSPSVAPLVLPVAIGTLVFGIKRTLRWMYGPNVERAEDTKHAADHLGPDHPVDELPKRRALGFNTAVIGCLLVLAALVTFAYR